MKRILLVDDDAELVAELAEALEGGDFLVDVAGDANECARRIAAGRYDLLLLDYKLPGGDGIGLLQRLRGRMDIPPVILISGSLNLSDLVAAAGLQRVVKAIVSKPFDIGVLVAAINSG